MIQAKGQGQKTLPDDTPVTTPVDLQVGFLMDRWGIEVLGPDPDLKQIIKSDRALAIYRAFNTDMKNRTENDWAMIRDTIAILEGWQ